MDMWSPAECGHCGYEIFPAKHAAAMGWSHEHAPTGWVHNEDMIGKPHETYCEKGCKDSRGQQEKTSHHHAHPADNRSVEGEEHGANEFMAEHDLGQEVSKIIKSAEPN
jgi:hypothetical protein